MPAPKKRPYVRPRIGHSMLRSLWYLFAFLGVVVVAFLLPRSPVTVQQFDGDWLLQADGSPGGFPAGQVELMVVQGRYALHFAASDGSFQIVRGVEFGGLEETGSSLVLQPHQGFYQDASGRWHDTLPPPRRFSIRFEGDRLLLEDAAGGVLSGFSRSRFAP